MCSKYLLAITLLLFCAAGDDKT